MNEIVITNLLDSINDYVLIKKSEDFPNYLKGSDIDLLVLDEKLAIDDIRKYFENLESDFSLDISIYNDHFHIDFLLKNQIELRVDLISNFSSFNKFSIKNSFKTKIFMDRKKLKFNSSLIYVPSIEDELTIRYFEYLEYFHLFPDKIKHLDFIINSDKNIMSKVIENSHRFITRNPKVWDYSSNLSIPNSRKGALKNIWLNISYIFQKTVKR